MDYQLTCPVCETVYDQPMKFCGECGCNLTEIDAVTVTVNPGSRKEKLVSSLKNQVQNIGQKAQEGLSGASSAIADKAFSVTNRANNLMVQERVSEAMGNLVNLMINVSKDVTSQIPADMVNAIDLEAEVNFIAFTIGVSIDLAELNKGKNSRVDQASNVEDTLPPPDPDTGL